jgi:hypothetical protein
MMDSDLVQALETLLRELSDGPAPGAAWILNPGDPGLLSSLDRLPAAEASLIPKGGSSVAAHVDHLRYGMELLNRWSRGDDPFADAALLPMPITASAGPGTGCRRGNGRSDGMPFGSSCPNGAKL